MYQYGSYFAIAFGVIMLLCIIISLYWGTFLLLISQPLFITAMSEESGFTASKVVYGVMFALWFIAWAIKPASGDAGVPRLHYSLRTPALAFGVMLFLAALLGVVYGAPPDWIVRDLSQYVGYLAVLPLLEVVRTPKQAKRLIFCLAMVGLPSFIASRIGGIAYKQHVELPPILMIFSNAAAYWGPIQGAIWVVAISFQGFVIKMLAWAWLILESGLSVFSGFRHMLLIFIISASTAFVVSGKIARHTLGRYMIPLFLALVVGGILADLSGMITLPFSYMTRDRYSTLLSAKSLEQDQTGRIYETKVLFQSFLENPFTGIGLGRTFKDRRLPGGQTVRFHNGYLETLMKFGLVGAAIFAWYFLTLFRQAFEVVRTSDDYFTKAIALGVVIWLVPAIAGSLAGSVFSERGFALTVGVMAGLLPALPSEKAPG